MGLIFDPVESELSVLQEAKELGIDRAEYCRRQNLKSEVLLSSPRRFARLSDRYGDGKAPVAPPPSNADLSQFGVPVK
jgi:hypothetical protein